MENNKNGEKTTLIITASTITSIGNLNRINTKNKQVDCIKTVTSVNGNRYKLHRMTYNTQHPTRVTKPPNMKHQCSTPAAHARRKTPLSSENTTVIMEPPPTTSTWWSRAKRSAKSEDPCICTIFSTFLPHLFTLFFPLRLCGAFTQLWAANFHGNSYATQTYFQRQDGSVEAYIGNWQLSCSL